MNRKYLFGGGIFGLILISLVIVFYLQKNALLRSVEQLHADSQSVRSLEELQQKVNDFFLATKKSTVSFLRSRASGTGSVTLTGLKNPGKYTIGSEVTVSGLGVNLPAYAVIGNGVVATPLISRSNDELSFVIPATVITPTCPPFPDALCKLVGVDSGSQLNEVPLSRGSYNLYVVTESGNVSNPVNIVID